RQDDRRRPPVADRLPWRLPAAHDDCRLALDSPGHLRPPGIETDRRVGGLAGPQAGLALGAWPLIRASTSKTTAKSCSPRPSARAAVMIDWVRPVAGSGTPL